MSKVDFSKKISNIIEHKIKALENLDYNEFLKKDEYFELALCLTYLTLSKEKIIDKELKNSKRLDRLTKHVGTLDIDVLFKQGFSSQMPIIVNAKENNNLWILDNIRDSIMHEMFEIDELKKCLIIKNDYFDRDLECEIPFSWIIDYAKNDILSKKISNDYKFKGFYYNSDKKKYSYLNTKKELLNTILYSVHITGNKFNIKNIENRIKEIFKECSLIETDENIIEQYQDKINNKNYNEKYLISFYYACDIVKEKINQEFPDTTVDIYLNERKNNLTNQAFKKMSSYYKNYDLLYNQLNEFIKPKGIVLLNYLTTIIENLNNHEKDIESNNLQDKMSLINSIITSEKKQYNSLNDLYNDFSKTLTILRTICINSCGICTLVINNNLYKEYYEKNNNDVLKLCAKSYTNQDYSQSAKTRKKLILDILEQDIKLFKKEIQLSKCTNLKGVSQLKMCINNILNKKNELKQTLDELEKNMRFSQYIDYNNYNPIRSDELSYIVNNYFKHFYKAQTVEGKKKVKKVISKILDLKIEDEIKYTYRYCNNSNEIIEILRNSLSHIGRINISPDNSNIIFNDYDNNHVHSGTVIIPYNYFLKLINNPLSKTEEKENLKTLKFK